MGTRKPRLRMEALIDLSSDELSGVAGGHTVDTTCCTCQTSINSQCGATTCVMLPTVIKPRTGELIVVDMGPVTAPVDALVDTHTY